MWSSTKSEQCMLHPHAAVEVRALAILPVCRRGSRGIVLLACVSVLGVRVHEQLRTRLRVFECLQVERIGARFVQLSSTRI